MEPGNVDGGDIPLEELSQRDPNGSEGSSLDGSEPAHVYVATRGGTLRSRSDHLSDVTDATTSLLRRLPSRRLQDDDDLVEKARNIRHRRHRSTRGSLHRRNPESLLEDQDFIDAPDEIRARNVRDFNATLHQKKEFLNRLNTQKRKGKKISCLRRTRWNISLAWSHFEQRLDEFSYTFEFWDGHMKKVEGHFGSGVASYFIFLKSIFYINISMFVLLLGFLTIPQVLYRYLAQEPPGYTQNVTFTGRELLTGGGWFQETELYYGFYLNGTIEILSNTHYHMPYAYILTCGSYYLLSVIIVAVILSRSYRHHYIEESGASRSVSSSKVFCGWDYKITDTEAADLKHKMLYKEYSEYLAGISHEMTRQSCMRMTALVLVRIAINVFFLGLLVGAGYLVWYISITQSLHNDYDMLKDLAMPLCITAINFILPFAFSILGTFEKYSNPRVEMTLTMTRTMTLYLVTLGVLLYFWYNDLECHMEPSAELSWTVEEKDCKPCWETFMGEQLYRLVIMDFIFSMISTFFSEFIVRVVSQCCVRSLGSPTFNIGRNTLGVVYSQMLVWLGVFYSPLLPFINIIKLFIMFYVKRVSVLRNCAPSSKPWRAGQTHTFVLLLLFIAFVSCFIAVAYGIVFIHPSPVCGPYQGYNSTYDVIRDMFTSWEATDNGHMFNSFIGIITSEGFLAFVVIGFGVAAYYCKVTAHAHNEMVKRLRRQIAMEGKDKKFLVQLFQQAISQGLSSHTTNSSGRNSFNRYPQAGNRPGMSQPGVSRRKPSASAHSVLTPPQEHRVLEEANESFLNQSVSSDSTDQGQGAGARPKDPVDRRQPRPDSAHLEAQNPMYREHSPHRKPDLPFHKIYSPIEDQHV